MVFIWIILAVITGFVLGGTACWAFYGYPNITTDQIAQHITAEATNNQDHQTLSIWVPRDSIGLYTLVLAIFTGLLFVVSTVQIVFLTIADQRTVEALSISAKSAEATRITAEAAIAAEQAHLNIIMDGMNCERPFKAAKKYPNTPSMDTQVFDPPGVMFRFKNMGKTPAILYEVRYGMNFTGVDKEGDRAWMVTRKVEFIGASDESDIYSCTYPGTFTLAMAKEIERNLARLIFYGVVTFIDAFNVVRTIQWEARGYSEGFKLISYGRSIIEHKNS